MRQNPAVRKLNRRKSLVSPRACGGHKGDRAMEVLASSEVFLFEDFRLDRRGAGLFQGDGGGAFLPVAIGSRGLDILGVLIDRAGEIVSKDEIIAAVWPGTVVEDSNLTVQVSALRRVLDQGRPNGR